MDTQTSPSREEMANYLAGHDAGGGFSSLGADVQNQVLDALSHMESMERNNMLQRLQQMDQSDREQVVGSLVHLGAGALQQRSPANTKQYTVQPGDSLAKISRSYNIGLQALIRANPQIKNPDLIHPNQIIHLP